MSVVKDTNTREYRLFHSNIATLADGIKNELTAFTTEALARNLISSDGARAALNTNHPPHDRAIALLLNLLDGISFRSEEFYTILEILWNIPNLQTIATVVDPSYTDPHPSSSASRNNIGNVSSSISTTEPVLMANRMAFNTQPNTVTSHQRLSPNCKPLVIPPDTTKPVPTNRDELKGKISALKREFEELVDSVEDSFAKNVSLEKVQRSIKHIPVSLQQERGEYFLEKAAKILSTKSMEELFIVLAFCWDYLNPGLLEFLVGRFGSESDIASLRVYLGKLNQFRMSIKVGDYLLVRHGDINLSYRNRVLMLMGDDWAQRTLQDVEEFKIRLCQECRIQEFLPLIYLMRSSIVFIFCVPHSIEINLEELKPFFDKECVICAYETCLNFTAHNLASRLIIIHNLCVLGKKMDELTIERETLKEEFEGISVFKLPQERFVESISTSSEMSMVKSMTGSIIYLNQYHLATRQLSTSKFFSTFFPGEAAGEPPTTRLHEEDFDRLFDKLRLYSHKWRQIAHELHFTDAELSTIEATLTGAPYGHLHAMLSRWLQWAPGDARGSRDYATLESLRRAVERAGLGLVAREL